MKKIFFLVFLLCLSKGVEAASESKSASPAVPFKEVSSKVAEAFCVKMDQCSKQKIPLSQCNSEMSDLFQQNYNALPPEKKVQVPSEQLGLCVKSIKASSCETLKKTSSLEGCDFIAKLSS